MSDSNKNGFFANIKNDFPASIVVFLVALPLCLGIALASEAPPLSGIIAGIIGGIIVGLISKSPLGVSGPAAGLASIVASTISDLASFEGFLVAVILAGIIQILIGVIKAGVIAYYFPNAVIKGMLAGIGVIIFMKQIPHAFGYDKDPEGDFRFEQTDGHTTFSELDYMLDSINFGAIIIAVVGLIILILWETQFIKKSKILSLVPGPLLAVIFGIVSTVLFVGTSFEISGEHLVNINLGSSFSEVTSNMAFPDFSFLLKPEIYVAGITIAVVASLETLLCVEATDKLDPQKRVTPPNRELIAQGAGNMISGLIGGLPITQVIVRSSANIQSGGKSKASAVFHGILMLVCVLAIPSILSMIPYAALAAVLMLVGYKLAKPKLFIDMYKKGWSQFLPFIITVAIVYRVGLLEGIGLGLAYSIVHILYNSYKTAFYKFDEDEFDIEKPVVFQLSEHVNFLHKASILEALGKIPEGAKVVIDAGQTQTIHSDIIEIIDDFESTVEAKNIQLTKLGFNSGPFVTKPD